MAFCKTILLTSPGKEALVMKEGRRMFFFLSYRSLNTSSELGSPPIYCCHSKQTVEDSHSSTYCQTFMFLGSSNTYFGNAPMVGEVPLRGGTPFPLLAHTVTHIYRQTVKENKKKSNGVPF